MISLSHFYESIQMGYTTHARYAFILASVPTNSILKERNRQKKLCVWLIWISNCTSVQSCLLKHSFNTWHYWLSCLLNMSFVICSVSICRGNISLFMIVFLPGVSVVSIFQLLSIYICRLLLVLYYCLPAAFADSIFLLSFTWFNKW